MTSPKDLPASLRCEEQPAPTVATKQSYRAFETASGERRHLEIRLKFPEPAECPSYSRLSNIRAEWRAGQAISLGYGQTREGLEMLVSIRGENLTELHRALLEWKVTWIAEFDEQEHEAPTDDGAPFIKSITIHTTRPEEAPPVNKRH